MCTWKAHFSSAIIFIPKKKQRDNNWQKKNRKRRTQQIVQSNILHSLKLGHEIYYWVGESGGQRNMAKSGQTSWMNISFYTFSFIRPKLFVSFLLENEIDRINDSILIWIKIVQSPIGFDWIESMFVCKLCVCVLDQWHWYLFAFDESLAC